MPKHILESAIEDAALECGFERVRSRRWRLAVGDYAEAGILAYGISKVSPGEKQFEVVLSHSYLPAARVLNWSSAGLRRPSRSPHPTLTWNATTQFPDGRLWHARIDSAHGAAAVTVELSGILRKRFVPYVRSHGDLSTITSLISSIGGWAAFQFQFALLVLDGQCTLARVLRVAETYGIAKPRAKELIAEYAGIPSSYVDACKKPNQSPEPTVMSVTPRADARVAPATAVAHL